MADSRRSLDRRASTNSQHIDTRRRSSTRDSNPDVFSDDHAIDGAPVADGFRPSSRPASTISLPHPHTTLPRPIGRRSVALQPNSRQDENAKPKLPVPHGTSLGLGPRNSFSLRHDALQSDMPRRIPSIASSTNSVSLPRPVSNLSLPGAHRAQSPYNGPDGPSHPYGLYPQNIALNRSSTTGSTRPSERPLLGPHRPTHPYGMYPQDTSVESDPFVDPADIANVGFLGLGQRYQRRLGPDGEEADDIVGPDGHAEPLPPYTRYPEVEALPRKEAYAAPASVRPRSATEPPRTAATEASVGDRLLPEGQPSPSLTYGEPPSSGSSTLPVSEQGLTTKEKWTERSKKRVCGGKLPRWVLILGFILAIIVAATLGGVIGKLVGKAKYQTAPGTPHNSEPLSNDG